MYIQWSTHIWPEPVSENVASVVVVRCGFLWITQFLIFDAPVEATELTT